LPTYKKVKKSESLTNIENGKNENVAIL
jgi:hypothetical protein